MREIITMDSYDNLPDTQITAKGPISERFLELGINSYQQACLYIHDLKYGYNSNYDEKMILFKERKGTCTTKHAIAAGLAEELGIPLYKHVGIYRFTDEISDNADNIAEKYNLPYVPMVHCFLSYKDKRFDLTEGNNNGKKSPINNFIHTEKVDPFISRKEEYRLFRKVLKEKILPSDEMAEIKEKDLLKARLEGVELLKKNMK